MPSMPRRCGCKRCVHQSCRSPLTRQQRVAEDRSSSKTAVRHATVGRNGRRARCSTRTIRLLTLIPAVPRLVFHVTRACLLLALAVRSFRIRSTAVTLRFLDNIGTFGALRPDRTINPSFPLEIRGAPGVPASGGPPFGVIGFNAPSLLGTRYHAPYLHNGAAQTFTGAPGSDVFTLHLLPATPGPAIPTEHYDYHPDGAERCGASGSGGVSERHRRPHG